MTTKKAAKRSKKADPRKSSDVQEQSAKRRAKVQRAVTRKLSFNANQLQEKFSERQQAQAKLNYLASFPEVNPNPVVGLKVDASVQYVNPAAQQLFPDLQDKGSHHEWLADLKSIGTFLKDKKKTSYVREIRIGNAWFEQVFFLTPIQDQIRIYGRNITKRKRVEEERERLIHSLQEALEKIRRLQGMLPICASCKKIRDDKGYWNQIEAYIEEHSEAEFTHGICPDCVNKLYGISLDEDGGSRIPENV